MRSDLALRGLERVGHGNSLPLGAFPRFRLFAFPAVAPDIGWTVGARPTVSRLTVVIATTRACVTSVRMAGKPYIGHLDHLLPVESLGILQNAEGLPLRYLMFCSSLRSYSSWALRLFSRSFCRSLMQSGHVSGLCDMRVNFPSSVVKEQMSQTLSAREGAGTTVSCWEYKKRLLRNLRKK